MILDCGCIVADGQIDGACETHGLGETLRAEVDRLRTTLDRSLKALVLTHDYFGHDGLPMIAGWEWFDAAQEIVALLPETTWTREFTERLAAAANPTSNVASNPDPDAPEPEEPRG